MLFLPFVRITTPPWRFQHSFLAVTTPRETTPLICPCLYPRRGLRHRIAAPSIKCAKHCMRIADFAVGRCIFRRKQFDEACKIGIIVGTLGATSIVCRWKGELQTRQRSSNSNAESIYQSLYSQPQGSLRTRLFGRLLLQSGWHQAHCGINSLSWSNYEITVEMRPPYWILYFAT